MEPSAIVPGLGLAYVTRLNIENRFPFQYAGDVPGSAVSTLALEEDGRPLGPAHSQHADIHAKGSGRFSHWSDSLYFSMSDGTDPRTNGRGYTANVSARVSGGCPYRPSFFADGSIVGHAVLGCALTLAQWSMEAGTARALLSKTGTFLCRDFATGLSSQPCSTGAARCLGAGGSLRATSRSTCVDIILVAAGTLAH